MQPATKRMIAGTAVLLAVAAGLFVLQHFYLVAYFEREFARFDSTNIRGIIRSQWARSSGYFVELGADTSYQFQPIVGPLNNNQPFFRAVSVGDSIIKPPFADTLAIRTDEDRFVFYTFKLYRD